jgi:hypothetical protein
MQPQHQSPLLLLTLLLLLAVPAPAGAIGWPFRWGGGGRGEQQQQQQQQQQVAAAAAANGGSVNPTAACEAALLMPSTAADAGAAATAEERVLSSSSSAGGGKKGNQRQQQKLATFQARRKHTADLDGVLLIWACFVCICVGGWVGWKVGVLEGLMWFDGTDMCDITQPSHNTKRKQSTSGEQRGQQRAVARVSVVGGVQGPDPQRAELDAGACLRV